jgi:hypothetical protein
VNSPELSQDNSSTNQSDFVANTQIDNAATAETHDPGDVETIPFLVQQDIQFLKESWANLADSEDHMNIHVPVPPLILDKPPDIPLIDVNKHADNVSPSTTENDGFQLVTSRKKSFKTNASNQKSSYITRSKVGSPKPFK